MKINPLQEEKIEQVLPDVAFKSGLFFWNGFAALQWIVGILIPYHRCTANLQTAAWIAPRRLFPFHLILFSPLWKACVILLNFSNVLQENPNTDNSEADKFLHKTLIFYRILMTIFRVNTRSTMTFHAISLAIWIDAA